MKTSYRKKTRKMVNKTDSVIVVALPVGSTSGSDSGSVFGSSLSATSASFNLSS